MSIRDIGTGVLTEIEFTAKCECRAVFHPDGETPSYYNTFPIPNSQGMAMVEMGWPGKRVMVRECSTAGVVTGYQFSLTSEKDVPVPPGEIRKLREEWAAMRKELDAREGPVGGPSRGKLLADLEMARRKLAVAQKELGEKTLILARIESALKV